MYTVGVLEKENIYIKKNWDVALAGAPNKVHANTITNSRLSLNLRDWHKSMAPSATTSPASTYKRCLSPPEKKKKNKITASLNETIIYLQISLMKQV